MRHFPRLPARRASRKLLKLSLMLAVSLEVLPSPAVDIDVTGNWREGEAFPAHIQTREPDIGREGDRTFHQSLVIPGKGCRLVLEYQPTLDVRPGRAVGKKYDTFDFLSINGEAQSSPMRKIPYEGKEAPVRGRPHDRFLAAFDLGRHAPGEIVPLRLTWRATRAPKTTLECAELTREKSSFAAIPPDGPGEMLGAHGIPFLARKIEYFESTLARNLDRGGLAPWKDGMTFDARGVRAYRIHFLGMIHSLDIGNGSWYAPKGDHGYSHFVGDQAGTIRIEWADGEKSEVPLVFGFNIWWSQPWDMFWNGGPQLSHDNIDDKMLPGRDEIRDAIRDGVALVDGIRPIGSQSCGARFIFSLETGGRAVRSLSVQGDALLHDYPVISAVTIETSQRDALPPLPTLTNDPPNVNAVPLASIEQGDYRPGVERIMHALYVFDEDQPKLAQPEIPDGYFGPAFDFRGNRTATYAATYLYRNGPECASHIADTGLGCASTTSSGSLMHYIRGMGIWFSTNPAYGSLQNWFRLYQEKPPGELPGGKNEWSRASGELVRETAAFGYTRFIDAYLDWVDKTLYDEANPPHWNRALGAPKFGTQKIMVGDVEERGNRENDGHGIIMWGRYMAWHWLGRSREWNERRFQATSDAVEWIQWQLDNDTLRPGVRKDVLFTESECAHSSYDIYSSYNCLHGVKLSIRMAEQLGRRDKVEPWTRLYERLRQGILDNLVDESESGPIWHTDEHCDWQDHGHKLVHIDLAPDGDTYTPLQDYAAKDGTERRMLEISRNSYRHLMRDQNYNCLRMFGYGQGMMLQTALLLDEMEDAEKFLDMMLNHVYLPQLAGWTGPEGIILHRSGKYYLPMNGYAGQDAHVADSTKAVRLTVGIDDNDPANLRLVPRFPARWTHMKIKDFPAFAGGGMQRVSYEFTRKEGGCEFSVAFEKPVGRFSVRLGPFARGRVPSTCHVDDEDWKRRTEASGDSDWVWVEGLSGSKKRIVLK